MKHAEGYCQLSLFDSISDEIPRKNNANYYNKEPVFLSTQIIDKLKNYNLDVYVDDLTKIGLEKTWDYICEYILKYGENECFLNISNFGEMYEIGLAVQDKIQKKKSGQYYTPDDVALVMANWLDKCEGENVCDVACGTGKLILTYLDIIGFDRAKNLIDNGHLYLYDFDHVALKICKTAIIMKYGINKPELIHDIYCDFLDRNVVLPENSKVISNPPYASIENIEDYWNHTNVLLDTKELYSTFMEKIFEQAKSTVIITPFSFVSGSKFYSLRRKMSDIGNGFIVSFDNVPGNIFCGRKHGIFNTNTANSVRASITVLKRDYVLKGFKVSPLIRFKNEEREKLLKCDILENELPEKLQIVNKEEKTFKKISKSLEGVFYDWVSKSKYELKDFINKKEKGFLLDVPNTCRYYTTCSARKLNRTGSITSYIENKEQFEFVYCLINSSFVYWWWRVFDGGITYPTSLFNSIPVPFNLLDSNDMAFFHSMYEEMSKKQDEFVITKMNAGVAQENIKFPEEYRAKINSRILKIIGRNENQSIFDEVHKNKYFE